LGSRFTELVIDAADPEQLAAFWAAVLGWQPTGRYSGAVEIAAESGGGPSLTFVPDANRKRGKNRLHIDVNPTGCTQDEEVARLLALGATHVDIGQGSGKPWVVLADPEGNEFCVLRDRVD
jgi:catechol 2,3-dioxygenase-like lactoylglutathione lyase family enzyme